MKTKLLLSLICTASLSAWGQQTARNEQLMASADLTQLSLSDLMQIPVTSVSRSPQKLSGTAAAVTVITDDDIRRSGAINIAEALRLVPGLQVARVDSHNWAISSRGFNEVFANKLLVMIDGRTVYTPLFSGVFWDVQDTVLEDIDRIEVIRGPGATVWGANAVNGVINIITKKAKDTQGWMVSGGGGTQEHGFGTVRYGGKINDDAHFNVYTKYFNRDDLALPSGADSNDRWNMIRGGFRIDWEPGDINLFTLQGDIYDGELNQTYTVPSFAPPFVSTASDAINVRGGNLLGRWTHTISDSSDLTIQAYFDRTERHTSIFGEDRDTGDIDFQHRFELGDRQELVWGMGYRITSDQIDNSTSVSLFPQERTSHLYSAFIQDEIELVPDQWRLTLGTKLEHNDFTGIEVQPGARLLWLPHPKHSVWASVARAVRTPSRAEDDVRINPPGAPPGFARISGTRSFDSEELIAYELGYRVQPKESLSIDIATFYNDYDDLRSVEVAPGPGMRRVLGNQLYGETYGFEISSSVQVSDPWRLHAGYSFLEMQLHTRPGSTDATSEAAEGASPQQQFFVRSSLDLGRNWDFDTIVRYVDSIRISNSVISNPVVPSYVALDLRLAWHPSQNWEFAIVGQNLLDDRHPEFYSTTIPTLATEVERSVYAKLTWRF